MQATKLNVGITPELALAIEAGTKDALKALMPKGDDARKKVASDQKLKGIKVDMTLEIEEVAIGHDTDKAPTVAAPTLAVLALLMKKMGTSPAQLRDLYKEAALLDESAEKALIQEQGVGQTIKEFTTEAAAQLPRTPVAKPVKAKGAKITVTGVSQAQ